MAAQLIPVSLRTLVPPQDDLYAALLESKLSIQERDIVVVTSKVISIHQGRCIKNSVGVDKEKLAQEEADLFLPAASSKYGISLTVTHSALIPTAGIDESNADDHLVLLPECPNRAAQEVYQLLKKRFKVNELGVVVTDSHCTPLRWGVTGISIGMYGFEPLHDYRDKLDLFGRPFKFSQTNIVDSIAAAAVGVMGEGAEGTPVVVVRDWPRVSFLDDCKFGSLTIKPEEDVFAPLLKVFFEKGDYHE